MLALFCLVAQTVGWRLLLFVFSVGGAEGPLLKRAFLENGCGVSKAPGSAHTPSHGASETVWLHIRVWEIRSEKSVRTIIIYGKMCFVVTAASGKLQPSDEDKTKIILNLRWYPLQ